MSVVQVIRKPALLLDPNDDVMIATRPLKEGARFGDEETVCRQAIPAGHKIAVRALAIGAPVRRYNQIIGFATAAIEPGDHVHSHNLAFENYERDYAIGADVRDQPKATEPATFMGIRRPDGRVATRNYIGVISMVNCSATVAQAVAAHYTPERLMQWPYIDGVVPLTHSVGCGMASEGQGMDMLRRTLAGFARHPNFAGVVLIGLGCEANQLDNLFAAQGLGESSALKPLVIQTSGGTRKTIEAAIKAIDGMLPKANDVQREPVPASELVVALQCGGSDGYSGITANPALGAAVDILVSHGGTAILSETPEIYGAEHLLTRRAVSEDVANKLIERIHWWENYTSRNDGSLDNNPSPGNKAGGLTTILEKSLGAVAKGGTTNLVGVYEYAEPVTARGFVFMDTPGYDPCSITGQVAGGANLITFTTGRGSVYGCKPVPSLKLATNTPMYERLSEDMDINCGDIVDGASTVRQKGEQIFQRWLSLASNEKSLSEELGVGSHEFIPWFVGAVM
ncbi:MAG: altronate dehydratase family protein [Burkholderiaceae bacterium]